MPPPTPAHDERADDPRGRHAESPTQLPAAAWGDVAGRVKGQIRDDVVPLMSAGVAFYGFLALIPALIATVSIYGLVASPQDVTRLADDALEAAPPEVRSLLEAQLTSITETSDTGLGFAAAASIAIALWTASSGMAALCQALTIAYNEGDTRGFVARRAQALLLTIGAIGFVIVAVGLIIALPAAVGASDLGSTAGWVLNLIRWPLLLAGFLVGLAILYRHGPNREEPELRWTSPGALIATVVWIVASIGFSFYTSNFGSYNETYGSLGAVVVLLLWLWITALVVMLGAEINSELEHQTTRDTTTGDDEPLGRRGAWSADHGADAEGETGAAEHETDLEARESARASAT